MPQTPIELLKSLAMRNVPTRPSTEMELENQAFRAQAIQDADPSPWHKAGRHAIEALTGFFTNDPTAPLSDYHAKGITNPSTDASQLGGIGNLLPMGAAMGGLKKLGAPKSLSIIAPEAYSDVKAGGLKLYSRLTDTFAKAPAAMKPAKAISLAQSGASKEEISLRKLNDFLKGRDPMGDIPREEIMGHLASNPLELDVVRKGEGYISPERREFNRFTHEMDTKYGPNWNKADNPHVEPGSVVITPEETRRFRELADLEANADTPSSAIAQHDDLQTPGPKENYGESLINLPVKNSLLEGIQDGEFLDDFAARTNQTTSDLAQEYGRNTFETSHWDEPNNLVWSRHNDRRLNPTNVETSYGDGTHLRTSETAEGGSKGRFIEEIQSDWHQQGRDKGYKGDPLPEHEVRKLYGTGPGGTRREGEYFVESDYFPAKTSSYADTPEEALERFTAGVDQARPPDAPFKDTYHELALKQQLLDAANDPSLEWLGVADAVTNAKLEGHLEPTGGGVRGGTDLYYDQKHPSALQKLLEPLGGEVEYGNLPVASSHWPQEATVHDVASKPQRWGLNELRLDDMPVASTINDQQYKVAGELMDKQRAGWRPPGPGMWKANLPPELKELIKTRGFPAMMALLALQQTQKEQ